MDANWRSAQAKFPQGIINDVASASESVDEVSRLEILTKIVKKVRDPALPIIPIVKRKLDPEVEQELMNGPSKMVYMRSTFEYAHQILEKCLYQEMAKKHPHDSLWFWSEFESGNLDFAF